MTNWATCCRTCNLRKGALPLDKFLKSLSLPTEDLPLYGDPIIDNPDIPVELRLLRRQIFDQVRRGDRSISGRSAQRKIEKAYRRELWETSDGQQLESEFPSLPGQVRVMIPEIRSIAKSKREFTLLIELAKSAKTRNLIGTVLVKEVDIESRVYSLYEREKRPTLKRRLEQALRRFERATNRDQQD